MNFYISDCHFGHKNIVAYDHRPFFSVDEGEHDIVLCHFPIPIYKNLHYGWYHFYGHVHETVDYEMTKKFLAEVSAKYEVPIRAYNVCATLLGYTPRTFDEITSKTGS